MHRFKRFAGSCIKTLGQTGKTAIIFIPMNTETKYNVGWHTEEGFSETATEPSLTLALSGDITKPPLSRRRGDGSPAVTSKQRGDGHILSLLTKLLVIHLESDPLTMLLSVLQSWGGLKKVCSLHSPIPLWPPSLPPQGKQHSYVSPSQSGILAVSTNSSCSDGDSGLCRRPRVLADQMFNIFIG